MTGSPRVLNPEYPGFSKRGGPKDMLDLQVDDSEEFGIQSHSETFPRITRNRTIERRRSPHPGSFHLSQSGSPGNQKLGQICALTLNAETSAAASNTEPSLQ